jgi:hypothetical protein
VYISHFSRFSLFLPIFQGIQCFCLIFHFFFSFLSQSRTYSVYISYFSFFTVSLHIPGPTVCASHFACFSVFLAIFHVLPCEFLIFLVGHVTRHIPGHRVCISHFLRFSVFLTIFLVIHFLCLIFHVFQFSCHNPGPTVYFSCLTFFSVSCHIPVPTMCFFFHFAHFSVFLAIFHVLPCEFLIFLICQFSRLFQVLQVCVSHIPHFSILSP